MVSLKPRKRFKGAKNSLCLKTSCAVPVILSSVRITHSRRTVSLFKAFFHKRFKDAKNSLCLLMKITVDFQLFSLVLQFIYLFILSSVKNTHSRGTVSLFKVGWTSPFLHIRFIDTRIIFNNKKYRNSKTVFGPSAVKSELIFK